MLYISQKYSISEIPADLLFGILISNLLFGIIGDFWGSDLVYAIFRILPGLAHENAPFGPTARIIWTLLV